MTVNTDIVIIGGGLNGAMLALALASAKLKVHLIDQQPRKILSSDGFDGRAYALAAPSVRMCKILGLWSEIADYTQEILDIKVYDNAFAKNTAPHFLHFAHHEIEEDSIGHIVEDRYLRRALMMRLEHNKYITCLYGHSLIHSETKPHCIDITLNNNSIITARLLIGCDGRNSTVAKHAGIKKTGWDYDQSALVCAIGHQYPHHGIAHQFFTPSGPLGILPLRGNISSIVWAEKRNRAQEIHAMNDDDYLNALRPVFGDFLGKITLCGNRFHYPLSLSISHELVQDRKALLGDAAHGIHPLAGQGFNLGLRDIAALCEILSQAKQRGEDIGHISILKRYQTWRRFDTLAMAIATDGINKIFSNNNPLLRNLRNIGLATLNKSPLMRRNLMRHAAGLNGDIPKLLLGMPL